MKMRFKIIVIIFVISLFTISCKVYYLISYQTYLENSPDESLHFKDSIISVSFITQPNGIVFDIENLTENNLYLIWDKSYFIEPSGSSSKPLNTDILETNAAIRDKENYESVIPKGGHFSRFTCSVKNISLFSRYNTITFYNEVTKSIHSYTDYSKFCLTGTYWYLGSNRVYDSKSEITNLDTMEIIDAQKFITNNNKLGLGFTIRNIEREVEYHFKFPIKNVEILKKTNVDSSYTLSYVLDKNSGFTPIIIR